WVDDLTTGLPALLRNQNVVGSSFAATAPLTPGHSYRWWARAVDASNTNYGAWSASADFAVAFLAQPTLVGPFGWAYNDVPLLTWNGVAGADHYRIWLDDLTAGWSPAFQNNYVPGTSWTPPTPLQPGHSY